MGAAPPHGRLHQPGHGASVGVALLRWPPDSCDKLSCGGVNPAHFQMLASLTSACLLDAVKMEAFIRRVLVPPGIRPRCTPS